MLSKFLNSGTQTKDLRAIIAATPTMSQLDHGATRPILKKDGNPASINVMVSQLTRLMKPGFTFIYLLSLCQKKSQTVRILPVWRLPGNVIAFAVIFSTLKAIQIPCVHSFCRSVTETERSTDWRTEKACYIRDSLTTENIKFLWWLIWWLILWLKTESCEGSGLSTIESTQVQDSHP